MDNDDNLIKYNTLISGFTECRINHDEGRICELIEYVRAEGILYQDFPEKNAQLLELLLKIALDSINQPVIFASEKLWWYVLEVYDIVFHQVRLDDYLPVCAELYFKLSDKVLDEKFCRFYKVDSGMPSYRMCIYFILMSEDWFASREQEFLAYLKN